MANEPVKMYSVSLVIRKRQTRTMRYHFTSRRMAKTRKLDNSSCCFTEVDPSYILLVGL